MPPDTADDRVTLRHVAQLAARGPLVLDHDDRVHALALDLPPGAAVPYVRAVVGRRVEVVGHAPVLIGLPENGVPLRRRMTAEGHQVLEQFGQNGLVRRGDLQLQMRVLVRSCDRCRTAARRNGPAVRSPCRRSRSEAANRPGGLPPRRVSLRSDRDIVSRTPLMGLLAFRHEGFELGQRAAERGRRSQGRRHGVGRLVAVSGDADHGALVAGNDPLLDELASDGQGGAAAGSVKMPSVRASSPMASMISASVAAAPLPPDSRTVRRRGTRPRGLPMAIRLGDGVRTDRLRIVEAFVEGVDDRRASAACAA